MYPEPKSSPWGEVQTCDKICDGVFDVGTNHNGGIMVNLNVADSIISPIARECGVNTGDYLCFEDGFNVSVAFRELADKGLYVFPSKDAELDINETIQKFCSEYWLDRKQRITSLQQQLISDRQGKNLAGPIIRAHITNPKDMADMFLSLDRLRDSDYARKWHDFPTTKEEMQATLKEIRVDGVKHSEYYINDYESSIPGLAERLQAGADIDELNYLAVKLAGMDDFELEKFSAALEYGVFREGLADIINTAENLDCFDIQPTYSAEMYGEFLSIMGSDEFAGTIERLEKSHDPDMRDLAAYITRLEKYFNAEAYGRDVVKAQNGVFTEQGYLTKSEGFREVYRGPEDIPAEYRVSAPPECVPKERPSVMDKLAAAKEAASRTGAEKSDTPKKSHDAEL